MLRRILFGLLFAIAGYMVGAFGGGYLVHLFSSNQHDREMEAAMTGAFVFGPALAAVAFLVGVMVTKPRSKA